MSDPRTALTAGGLADTYLGGIDVAQSTCSIDGCGGEVVARGWCRRHYNRWRRHGDPSVAEPRGRSPRARFDEKWRVTESGCWERTARTNGDGYGTFWNGERRPGSNGQRGTTIMVLAHRWAYEHFIGPIPEGLCVLHSCDHPPCVNPAHLFLGTQADNVEDCAAKGRRNQGGRFHKLSAQEHAEIRRRYGTVGEPRGSAARGTGGVSQQLLAEEYGVAQTTISAIVERGRG